MPPGAFSRGVGGLRNSCLTRQRFVVPTANECRKASHAYIMGLRMRLLDKLCCLLLLRNHICRSSGAAALLVSFLMMAARWQYQGGDNLSTWCQLTDACRGENCTHF